MPRRPSLEVGVREAIGRNRLQSSRLLIAVSGGSDSIALLHCLFSLRQEMGLILQVAHFNHDHRGDEAEEDARFVAEVAQKLGLPAHVEQADPLAYQVEQKISSFEAAAREMRYAFLGRVSRQVGAVAVALGHTADDQAETVLMHIIRGSGLDGLAGMTELSSTVSTPNAPSVALFRPLLGASKAETLAYCAERSLSYREDTGNVDPRYTRNQVRRHIIPALEVFNPRVTQALIRLGNTAAREVDYLEIQLDTIWPSVAVVDGLSIHLDVAFLKSLHPAQVNRVLRRAYLILAGDTRRLEQRHVEAMAQLLAASAGKEITLPRGLKLRVGYGQLVLERDNYADCPYPALSGEHPLKLPNIHASDPMPTYIPGWCISARRTAEPPPRPTGSPLSAYLDPDRLGTNPRVRGRRPGDRFRPSGMDASKKLQDFFVDQKVPRGWRDRIPLLESDAGIAWVVGYRVAEWARVSSLTQSALYLEFRPAPHES